MRLSHLTVRALALTAAPLALATAAFAQDSRVDIYLGGSSLSFPAVVDIGLCIDNTATLAAAPADCTDGNGVSHTAIGPYTYHVASIGSGAGLLNLFAEQGNNGTDGKTTKYTSTYPYSKWDLTTSDAALDTPAPVAGATGTSAALYSLTDKSNRGLVWQLPIAGTPVTLPYQFTGATPNFQLTPSPSDGESTELNLSTDALCYIWTGRDAKGNVVTEDKADGTPLLDSLGNTIDANNFRDWNAHVFTAQNNGQALFATGTVPTITPVVRSDASGTTYLFTAYLAKLTAGVPTCAAYSTQPSATIGGKKTFIDPVLSAQATGYAKSGATTEPTPVYVVADGKTKDGSGNVHNWWTKPATLPLEPSWVVNKSSSGAAASGSGGEATAVASYVGGTGYVAPNKTQPIVPSGLPTAYVQNNFSKTFPQFIPPNVANVQQAIVQVPPPAEKLSATQGKSADGSISYSTASAFYGTPLVQKFYNTHLSGAYPITGTTYLMGYQCYTADTSDDRYNAVLTLLHYITSGNADGAITAAGLIPLDIEEQANTTSGAVLLQAEANVLDGSYDVANGTNNQLATTNLPGGNGTSVDVAASQAAGTVVYDKTNHASFGNANINNTLLVGIKTTDTFPNYSFPAGTTTVDSSTKVIHGAPFNGPLACRSFKLDPHRG